MATPTPSENRPFEYMLKIAEEAKQLNPDLPSDMAENHDHYAHGAPLRWLARLVAQTEADESDLPADLALNHDHYQYGTPKKDEGISH